MATKKKMEVVPAEDLVPMGRILRELMDVRDALRKQSAMLDRIWKKLQEPRF